MDDLGPPYVRISGALDASDIEYLKDACKSYLSREGIPCYVLLDQLASPTCLKIQKAIERELGEPVYYLNDFYMYTDSTFKTGWHMDTELFTFERAVNAWILLSPNRVTDPLGFIEGVNDSPERTYRGLEVTGDECIFSDFHTGNAMVSSLTKIEAEQIHTPEVEIGDILLLNPKRFHKTNTSSPKHAIALKFIMNGPNGLLASPQVHACFWPEVALFNDLLQDATPWERFIAGLRRTLATEHGRRELSAGFYPAKFDFYRRAVEHL